MRKLLLLLPVFVVILLALAVTTAFAWNGGVQKTVDCDGVNISANPENPYWEDHSGASQIKWVVTDITGTGFFPWDTNSSLNGTVHVTWRKYTSSSFGDSWSATSQYHNENYNWSVNKPAGCTPPPPRDVCPNIPGNQEVIPEGMIKDQDGNCIPPPPVDVCLNLDGIQETVPEGWTVTDEGRCIPPPRDVCPNIDGLQEEVPSGMTVDEQGNCVPPPPPDIPQETPEAPPPRGLDTCVFPINGMVGEPYYVYYLDDADGLGNVVNGPFGYVEEKGITVLFRPDAAIDSQFLVTAGNPEQTLFTFTLVANGDCRVTEQAQSEPVTCPAGDCPPPLQEFLPPGGAMIDQCDPGRPVSHVFSDNIAFEIVYPDHSVNPVVRSNAFGTFYVAENLTAGYTIEWASQPTLINRYVSCSLYPGFWAINGPNLVYNPCMTVSDIALFLMNEFQLRYEDALPIARQVRLEGSAPLPEQ